MADRLLEGTRFANYLYGIPSGWTLGIHQCNVDDGVNPVGNIEAHSFEELLELGVFAAISDAVERVDQVYEPLILQELSEGSADFDELFVVRFSGVLFQGLTSPIVTLDETYIIIA